METVQDISHCSGMGQQSPRLNASEKKNTLDLQKPWSAHGDRQRAPRPFTRW